jgi:hypothetical protein
MTQRTISAILLAIGGFFFWSMTVEPLTLVFRARSWIPTECRITTSETVSQVYTDNTRPIGERRRTLRGPRIEFQYTYDSKSFTSNRYAIVTGLSTGGGGRGVALASKYPAGSAAICYVNPMKPSEAVLDRGLSGDVLFGLAPLLLLVVGLGGLNVLPERLWYVTFRPVGRAIEALIRVSARVSQSRRRGWSHLSADQQQTLRLLDIGAAGGVAFAAYKVQRLLFDGSFRQIPSLLDFDFAFILALAALVFFRRSAVAGVTLAAWCGLYVIAQVAAILFQYRLPPLFAAGQILYVNVSEFGALELIGVAAIAAGLRGALRYAAMKPAIEAALADVGADAE